MKNQNKVFGVLLTREAWEDATLSEALALYIRTGPIGKYIYCRKVDPNGYYFVMIASCKNADGSTFEAEICIPHRYVLCCVSATEKKQIGFLRE